MSLPDVRIVGAGGWLTASAVLVALMAFVWVLVAWMHAGVIGSMERRLHAAEERERKYAKLLHGRTPQEVAARIDALEARLAALPPRRLSDQQRSKLKEAGPPPPTASYLAVDFDAGVAEARRYAEDFVECFSAAPGWNVTSRGVMHLPQLPADIAVALAEPDEPTPTEALVLGVLSDIGLAHCLFKRTHSTAHVQIIVAAR